MNTAELRARIIEVQGYKPKPEGNAHGVANYLCNIVAPGWSEDTLFNVYGKLLGSTSANEELGYLF